VNLALPSRRPLAALVALAVLVAGLALSPFAATPAHAASNSSSAAAVLKSLNAHRVANDDAKFIANSTIAKYAQEYAALVAKKGSIYSDPGTPKTALPAGWITKNVIAAYTYGGTDASKPGRFATLYKTQANATVTGDYNYGAVGYVKKGMYAYAALVVAKYDPLLITPATPKISGTTTVGSTLTAKPGTYVPAADTYTYTWKRGTTTVGNAATYTPAPADLGSKLTVTVQGTKSGYAVPAAKTSAATKAITAGTMKLTYTVEGSRNVGETLSLENGNLTPAMALNNFTGESVQWYRNGKAIAGENDTEYELLPGDRGKKIDVKVGVTANGFKTVYVKTATKKVTGYPLLTARPVPTISGTPTFGQTLTVNPGTWQPGAVTLKYQWYVGGKAVSKATKTTFLIPSTAVGKAITVKVTGSKSGYATSSVTSLPTNAVAALTFTSAGSVSVAGEYAKGKTLTATVTGTSPSASYTYQWYVSDSNTKIKGATTSKLKLTQANIDQFAVRVVVTVKKAGYTTATISGMRGLN
jgi:hypothetical protein